MSIITQGVCKTCDRSGVLYIDAAYCSNICAAPINIKKRSIRDMFRLFLFIIYIGIFYLLYLYLK